MFPASIARPWLYQLFSGIHCLLSQTECGTSDFCTWTAVPDVGQVARANYYLERGIISEELFEQRLDEINKSEVCVPHRVAECAASSLMQGKFANSNFFPTPYLNWIHGMIFIIIFVGPHCSDTCAFLAVPTEDLLQGCQISQDPCCKYGVSEKACLSGIVVSHFTIALFNGSERQRQ